MTLRTAQKKFDDATYAAVNALGLSPEEQPHLCLMLVKAIRTWSKDLVTDDGEEAADPEPVKTYGIQVGRDAREYFSATATCALSDIRENVTRHGYAGDVDDGWKGIGTEIYDAVEVVNVTDPDTGKVIARWTEGDGWEESPES
jgi:hypothetical protein